jgi:hypothetical protein
MRVFLSLASLAVFFRATSADSWGPAYSLGPTTGAVIGTTYSFQSGTPPSPPEECFL